MPGEELPMRPRSIMLFERLYLLAIAIEMVRAASDWPQLVQPSSPDRWVRPASILVSLLLVLLASRRRHRWAGLVLGALFVIGLPMVATVLRPGQLLETSAVIVMQVVLQALALAFLIAPASRAWFAGASVAETPRAGEQ